MPLRERLERIFADQFGSMPEWIVRAPGRVNVIGEHVDYHGGVVMPMGIQRQTVLAAKVRPDRRIRIWSEDFGAMAEINSDRPSSDPAYPWSGYIAGVLAAFAPSNGEGRGQATATSLPGFDAAVISDIPMGSGLSSSAALTVCFARLCDAMLGEDHSPAELARRCQWAETEYGGVACGLMDPLCIANCRANHCLLIDCRSAQCQHVPWEDTDVSILIADSGVQRRLADTAYARRRKETAAAANILGVDSLCQASIEVLESCSADLGPVLLQRARHVVEEMERVRNAATALRGGDWPALGKLMSESHQSLRDLYEVSCPELDTLVEAASSLDGVFGSRLTGAGFGGCTVSLIRTNSSERIRGELESAYRRRTGRDLRCFESRPSQGAEVLSQGVSLA
jgi:galactokinase